MNNKIWLFYEESVPQTLCCCRLSAVLWVSLSVAGGHWALNPDSPSRCAHQLGLHKSSLPCAGCCERGHQGRSLSKIFRTKAVSHLDRVGLKPENSSWKYSWTPLKLWRQVFCSLAEGQISLPWGWAGQGRRQSRFFTLSCLVQDALDVTVPACPWHHCLVSPWHHQSALRAGTPWRKANSTALPAKDWQMGPVLLSSPEIQLENG